MRRENGQSVFLRLGAAFVGSYCLVSATVWLMTAVFVALGLPRGEVVIGLILVAIVIYPVVILWAICDQRLGLVYGLTGGGSVVYALTWVLRGGL